MYIKLIYDCRYTINIFMPIILLQFLQCLPKDYYFVLIILFITSGDFLLPLLIFYQLVSKYTSYIGPKSWLLRSAKIFSLFFVLPFLLKIADVGNFTGKVVALLWHGRVAHMINLRSIPKFLKPNRKKSSQDD